MSGPQDGLSIGELARRTGVPAATLRSWEDRYGFPRPQRLAGGHRRYDEAEPCSSRRSCGCGRPARACKPLSARPPPGRREAKYPSSPACALFGGFQQERFYRNSEERWQEIARTARVVVVFADFGRSSRPGTSPLTVRLPADSPLRREWFLVCAAPGHPAFVSGWEFPGQKATPDADRRFEVLWSVDPPAVQDAAMICAQLARTLSPGLDRLPDNLPAGSPPP